MQLTSDRLGGPHGGEWGDPSLSAQRLYVWQLSLQLAGNMCALSKSYFLVSVLIQMQFKQTLSEYFLYAMHWGDIQRWVTPSSCLGGTQSPTEEWKVGLSTASISMETMPIAIEMSPLLKRKTLNESAQKIKYHVHFLWQEQQIQMPVRISEGHGGSRDVERALWN